MTHLHWYLRFPHAQLFAIHHLHCISHCLTFLLISSWHHSVPFWIISLVYLSPQKLRLVFSQLYKCMQCRYCYPHMSTSSGKSKMISFLVKTSLRSLGVQNTSAALTQSPSSTKASLAMELNTSLVPVMLKPAPSNLRRWWSFEHKHDTFQVIIPRDTTQEEVLSRQTNRISRRTVSLNFKNDCHDDLGRTSRFLLARCARYVLL